MGLLEFTIFGVGVGFIFIFALTIYDIKVKKYVNEHESTEIFRLKRLIYKNKVILLKPIIEEYMELMGYKCYTVSQWGLDSRIQFSSDDIYSGKQEQVIIDDIEKKLEEVKELKKVLCCKKKR